MRSDVRILVPLDGKPESERFLPYLKEIAQAWQAELRLVRVVDSESVGSSRAATLEAERYLLQVAGSLKQVRVATVCRKGPVSRVLCELAEPGDLIAFAPRGHGGLARWIFGSVAEQVIRDARCPVLLLRGEAHVRFRHLLLPVGRSEASLEVCRRVQDFVPEDVRVTLLHCHERYLDYGWCETFEALVEGKPRWELACCAGQAADVICHWACSPGCDLIAMATRGRDGWDHFWHGSVTEEVARGAPCPVLVFPPACFHRHEALL